jgi:predicted component of type VI protein secretion system
MLLLPGVYVIGRYAGCQIVIDEPLVSRHHAELTVGHGSAAIRDMDSVNGLFVNGRQVAGSRMLSDGDRIGIGKEQIEISFMAGARHSPVPAPVRLGSSSASFGSEPASRTGGSGPPPSSAETTKQADALELIGFVADRAIEAGRVEHAEDVLRLHLKRVLEASKTGNQIVTESTAEASMRYALKLAAASGKDQWLHYALELMTVRKAVLSETIAAHLRDALERVNRVDLDRVEQYAKAVRAQPADIQQMRAMQRLDEIVRVARTKRSP